MVRETRTDASLKYTPNRDSSAAIVVVLRVDIERIDAEAAHTGVIVASRRPPAAAAALSVGGTAEVAGKRGTQSSLEVSYITRVASIVEWVEATRASIICW